MISRRTAIVGATTYFSDICCCHSSSITRSYGCYVAPDAADTMFSRSSPGEIAAPNLKGIQYGSGSKMFDYALARTLAHLSALSGTQPAFAFFDEEANKNAYATDASMLNGADGTILFGRKMISYLFKAFPVDIGPAVISICAHEFGHIVAYRKGIGSRLMTDRSKPFRSEQFADFFAGWYAGVRLSDNSGFPAVVFTQVLSSLTTKERGTHGTATDRMLAVGAGFSASKERRLDMNDAIREGMEYALQQPEF